MLRLLFGLRMLPSGFVLHRLGEGIVEEVMDRSGLPKADLVESLAPVHVFSAG
jgi:hypothetical protein